jgi:hypothetical protein
MSADTHHAGDAFDPTGDTSRLLPTRASTLGSLQPIRDSRWTAQSPSLPQLLAGRDAHLAAAAVAAAIIAVNTAAAAAAGCCLNLYVHEPRRRCAPLPLA